MFSERTYSVVEDDGPAQPVLVLSNPSSTPFNVTVTSTDGSATGEYRSILINYSYYNQEFIIVREEVSVLLYNNLPYSTKVLREKTFVVRSPCEFEKPEHLRQRRPLLDLLTQSVTALIR